MNPIHIKEKVAISKDFTPDERDFILNAINANFGGGKQQYPSRHPPGTHWATDAGWELLDTITPGSISLDVRAWLGGAIAGRLIREREDTEKRLQRWPGKLGGSSFVDCAFPNPVPGQGLEE
jgi:hypothetical protein